MNAEIQNANPTILNLSQLPTRNLDKRRAPRTGPGHDFDEMLFATPAYLAGPFDGGVDEGRMSGEEPIDEQEIYDLIANISDPEHPFSLGQLAVINLPDIHISPSPAAAAAAAAAAPSGSRIVHVQVDITPTVSHCSHATIIGLAVRVRLERCLPPNYRVEVRVKESTHAQDDQVSKQLGDKERVAAALENATMMQVLDSMLKGCE